MFPSQDSSCQPEQYLNKWGILILEKLMEKTWELPRSNCNFFVLIKIFFAINLKSKNLLFFGRRRRIYCICLAKDLILGLYEKEFDVSFWAKLVFCSLI